MKENFRNNYSYIFEEELLQEIESLAVYKEFKENDSCNWGDSDEEFLDDSEDDSEDEEEVTPPRRKKIRRSSS